MNGADTFLLADTWMHGGWGWGWMILMMVVMVLFWGAVIFGVVWLIRSTTGRSERGTESAIDVLERRFAEGAISVEDYHARRDVLLNGSAESHAARNTHEPVRPVHTAEGR